MAGQADPEMQRFIQNETEKQKLQVRILRVQTENSQNDIKFQNEIAKLKLFFLSF